MGRLHQQKPDGLRLSTKERVCLRTPRRAKCFSALSSRLGFRLQGTRREETIPIRALTRCSRYMITVMSLDLIWILCARPERCVSGQVLGYAGQNRGNCAGDREVMGQRIFEHLCRNCDNWHDEDSGGSG